MRLSIITINLNNKLGLEKTMHSIVSQTFSDFEYIVIDGGSSDESIDVINKYKHKITYWVSEKDNGIYNAQNKAIAVAKGEYCLFLNSGDYLVDSKILEKVFKNNFIEDILYGDMMIDKGDGKLKYGKQPEEITFEFLMETTIWHPVSFIKKTLFDKFGLYNEDLKIVADYDFFVKTILVNRVTKKHLPFAVSVFNTLGIGSSKQYEELHKKERTLVQEKYFSKEVIESAKRFIELKQTKAVIISDKLNKLPLLKNFARLFYNVAAAIKKIFVR
jgi:glycosyltransferase involved in cell wall biosynthesis